MDKFFENLKNKDFFCLWLAQIISQFGDRVNQMALIGLVAGLKPGSAIHLAKILSFTIIPVFIVGPIAGVYVDRWDRRTTLFICDFLRGLFILSIPLVFMMKGSMIPIYIVVFLAFCLSRFYVPAKMSIIPDLVEEKNLLIANSLINTTGMIAFVLGCAVGGFIVEKIGADGGFVTGAVTFFISGLLVFKMNGKPKLRINRDELLGLGKEVVGVIQKSVIGEIKEGVLYFLQHKEIRFIASMMFLLFAAAGAIYIVIIVFVQNAFNTVTKDLGILAVFLGIGLFVGSLLYGRWGEKSSQFKTIFFCLILGGLALLAFSIAVEHFTNRILAIALAFILGLVVGPIVIAANTIVHQVGDAKMLGKVFSSLEIVMHLAFLLTMLLSAAASEYIDAFWILVASGSVFVMIGFVGILRHRENQKIPGVA
ncbi:MAG: MFS transporter [Candidatus Omnitrophota bacterium]